MSDPHSKDWLADERPADGEPHAERRLLDLFPEELLEPVSKAPAETSGAATASPAPPWRPAPTPPDTLSRRDAPAHETPHAWGEKGLSPPGDPRSPYRSASFERAAAELLAAIRTRSGPALLTAPRGMGKSTLCRALVQELDRRTVTALVLEAPRSFDDLLKNMLASFGVMAPEDLAAAHVSRPQLTNALNSFLESLAPLNASAVVFVDQAHDIPVGLLVDLARVVAPGTPGARLLQLVLVGRPALTALLRHADLRDLNASIARRIELGPLEAGDISGYITHRLSKTAAGRRIDFDASAVTRLFERSSGVPRMVDLLCDRAMLRGQQAAVIDAALIEAVAADLDLDRVDGRPRLLNLLLIVAAFALLVLAGAGGALWIWRDSVSRAILEWENVPILPDGPVLPLPAPLAPIPPPAESSGNLPGNPAI